MPADAPSMLEPSWPNCSPSCPGRRVDPYHRCLAHLDKADLQAALRGLGPGADIDVRGTFLTEAMLARLLAAVSGEDRRPQMGIARFNAARFATDASFNHAQFTGDVSFNEAKFIG